MLVIEAFTNPNADDVLEKAEDGLLRLLCKMLLRLSKTTGAVEVESVAESYEHRVSHGV